MNITLVTPTISRAGGTEKCVSWLAEDLSNASKLEVVAAHISDTNVSSADVHLMKIVPHPRLLAYLSFLARNTLFFMFRSKRGLVLSTSGDCLFSNVVYAHFCCAAYLELIRRNKLELPAQTIRQRLRNYHYRLFLATAATVEKRIYNGRRLRSVVAVSEGVKKEIVNYYGVEPARIEVVVNAADDRVRLSDSERTGLRADQRQKLQLTDDEIVILFVAAGDWKRKGLALVIEALAKLQTPKVRLLVAGSEEADFYKGMARRLGVNTQVRFLGSVSEIERIYPCADVFVYPSAYEAFPLVVLEAAAAGLPLIVTATNGTEDIVVDGLNGLIVDRNVDEIACAMRKLVDDPQLRATMGERARISSQAHTRAAVSAAILSICTSVSNGTVNDR